MAAAVAIQGAKHALPRDHFLQPRHHRQRGFFFHQLRVIDLAGGIVENHQQVVPALVSGKGGESASRNVQLDLLAKAGPPVFVLGLLVLLSVAVSAPAKSALDRAVNIHSPPEEQKNRKRHNREQDQHTPGVLRNEFSLNPFYRNRLTRCYLGASNRKRAPNPLTGFDNRDTRGMQISRLRPIPVPQPQLALVRPRPTEIYTGPLTGNCKRHWARGKIRYPETPADQPSQESNEGEILYIKSSLTGAAKYNNIVLPSEPADVVNFKFMHKHFPHDTTANQWFTESQFESYRRLGYHVIDEIQTSGQWKQF